MGVDYTAFVAYGVAIKRLPDKCSNVDEFDELIPKGLGVGYCQSGSAYGREGESYLIIDSKSYVSVDYRSCERHAPFSPTADPTTVDDADQRIRQVTEATGVEVDGQPRWWLGLHVW